MPNRRQPTTVAKSTARPRTAGGAGGAGRGGSVSAGSARPAATRTQHLIEREQALDSAPAAEISPDREWTDAAIGAGLAVAVFVFYSFTAARYPVTGDGPELITVANILGVAHAPGYPLLTMTAHLFGLLPVGSYALRSSLYAAACGSACVGIVYATVRRLSEHRVAAASAAVALALTPLFWQWSIQFEVFALANLLAAALAYLLVRWYLEPGRRGWLVGAAFTFGLALTNQQVIVFVGPAIGWLLWQRRAELLRTPKVLAYATLALLAGLLPYVYVPIAAAQNPALSWNDARTAGNLYDLIARKTYGNQFTLLPGSSGLAGGNPLVRFGYLLAGIGFVVGLLALAGLVQAYRTQRWYFWFTIIAFGFSGALFQLPANIKATSPTAVFVLERFFLLPLVLVAPLAGLGVVLIGESLARHPSRRVQQIRVVAIAALGVAVIIAALNYRDVDLSHDRVAEQYARDILSGVAPNDVLIANGDETLGPLWYVHDALHVRPDVTIVVSSGLPAGWYDEELRRAGLSVPAHPNLLSFREANINRPFDYVGPVGDDGSMQGKFYVYHNGLTFNILAEALDKTPDQMAQDNTAKLASYHVPSERGLKNRSFEQTILLDYASVPYLVGDQYHQLKQDGPALVWYDKALAIDPGFPTFVNAVKALNK